MAGDRGHQIRLDDITHRFGDFVAVRDIDLDVGGGELVGLLGSSGCGKSTLLRIISGFIRQEHGRVLFDNEAVDHLALLDASYSLGASWWMTFRRVTLPLIGRGVGAFLAFMASFDNVPVSLFLADERTEVLPIHLWQQIETNLDVRTAAASGVIIVFTLVLMVAAERLAGLTRQLR